MHEIFFFPWKPFNSVNIDLFRFLLSHHSHHTHHTKRESIVIAWWKKNSLLLKNVHVLYVLEDKTSKKNFRLSVCPCLDVCTYVRTWTFHVDTITFGGASGSKQNLVGVFYIWNVALVFKSKVISWSWSWSWFWTEILSSQKLRGATPNLVDIFSIWVILLQIARILGKRKCDTLKFLKNFFPASLTKFNRQVLQDFAGKNFFT